MWDMERLWLEREKIDPSKGLQFEVFEWISSMVPIANVDLLILNDKNEVLLSWRDDEYFGKGWHIPGGCVRFKETLEERIQKTAESEIGTRVITDYEPIATKEVIVGKEQASHIKRAHHIAILYECHLPDGFEIDNGEKAKHDPGYLRWHSVIPADILPVHEVYTGVFKKYQLM